MNDFPKRQLLINYLLGLCTPGEEEEVEYWLDKEPGNITLLQEVSKEIGYEGRLSAADTIEVKDQLFAEVDNTADAGSAKRGYRPNAHIGRGLWLKVAAMVVVILTAGGLGLYYSDFSSFSEDSVTQFDQRTLSKGQTATLRFGDGSVIKLNAGSTLRYPEKFSRERREVYLEGEAFFSIAHDESRPFLVHAKNTTTRVLGTSFNIRAYSSEDALQVAVAEGEVAVSRAEEQPVSSRETIYVTRNQWVTYRSSGQLIEKGEGNIDDLIAWKDKRLIFTDKPLEEIAVQLERWYNVEVLLADSSLKKRRLSASFTDEPLSEVLTVIALSLDITYKQDGQVITFQENSL
ncbi:FecR family protein [Fodinibius sediminis]|nr:FecR domain-containing protein [Fodinibius sediminis]